MAPRSALPFEDGGWTEAVGGHVALELVNSVSWRGDPTRTVDRLPDASALVRWARWAGVLDEQQTDAFRRELGDDEGLGRRLTDQVRQGRELLHRVVQPLAVGSEPAGSDLATLQRWLVGALGRADLGSAMPLVWSTGLRSARDLPDELALHAWRLLEQEDARLLRECRGGGCGWLFLDRSRNGSRIWCSSADCGNRTRARRHYQRHGRTDRRSTGVGR